MRIDPTDTYREVYTSEGAMDAKILRTILVITKK